MLSWLVSLLIRATSWSASCFGVPLNETQPVCLAESGILLLAQLSAFWAHKVLPLRVIIGAEIAPSFPMPLKSMTPQ